jgi:hypothetical protein
VPTGSFADGTARGEGVAPGPSFGVSFALPGSGRRTLYAGFSQHRFACEDAGCAARGRYVATGFDVGFRFKVLRSGVAIPWVRVGALTTRVETEDLGAPDVGVSKLGLGAEVGAGVYIGGGSTVAINPGVRFSAVDTRLPGGATLGMRYLVADIAVVIAF